MYYKSLLIQHLSGKEIGRAQSNLYTCITKGREK